MSNPTSQITFVQQTWNKLVTAKGRMCIVSFEIVPERLFDIPFFQWMYKVMIKCALFFFLLKS